MCLFTCVYYYIRVWLCVWMWLCACGVQTAILSMITQKLQVSYFETVSHWLRRSTLGWLGSQQAQGSTCLYPSSTVFESLYHCNRLKKMDSEDFTTVLSIAEQKLQKELSSQISFSYLSMKGTLTFNDWREEILIIYVI